MMLIKIHQILHLKKKKKNQSGVLPCYIFFLSSLPIERSRNQFQKCYVDLKVDIMQNIETNNYNLSLKLSKYFSKQQLI